MLTYVLHTECHLGGPDFLEVEFVRIAAAQDGTEIGKFYRSIVRDPRPHREDNHLFFRVKLCVLGSFGPRADQTHLTEEDIQKLGKFVEFVFPYKSANARNSRIIVT